MGNVTLSTASVPEGTCPSWIIALWPQLVGLMSANLNGALNVLNYGSSTPAPADQGKPWIRLNSSGYFDKVYVFNGGVWLSPHQRPVGERLIAPAYITTAAQVWSYDGGDGTNPATTSPTGSVGAMWEIDPDLEGKFPFGAGLLGTATKLVGDTGGEENHSLTIAELAPHTHEVGVKYREVGCNGDCSALQKDADNGAGLISESTGGTGTPKVVTAHNNMPPYMTVMFIRRTNRLYYTP